MVAGDSGVPSAAPPSSWIPIERIRAYERNPRRAENPAYSDIKESIRIDGMLQPLIVTRRQGEEDYVVAAGGNTRLRAIKELFAESDDGRFARVYCVVRPWAGEKAVLAGHLKENDLRGDLTFIDRARAVLALLELIAEEQGGAALTQRQAVTALRDLGYVISQSLFSYIEYAVKRLGPLLPTALESGIGRRQVERIRSLERVAEVVWTRLSAKGAATAFAPAFEAACRKCDGPNWDHAALRYEVESEIARHVHVGLDTVREKLAVHLDGGDIKSDDLIESSAVAGAASVGIVPPAPPFGEPGASADSNGTGCRDPDDKTIRPGLHRLVAARRLRRDHRRPARLHPALGTGGLSASPGLGGPGCWPAVR